MGKPGIVMILLVLAVACMGGVAAGFSDELDVTGDVTAGTMQYEVLGWSETWVYGYSDEGAPQVLVLDEPADPGLFPPEQYTLLGAADVDDRDPGMLDDPDDETKEMSVTYDSVVPGIDFTADVVLSYTGSVPARFELSYLEFYGDDVLEEYLSVGYRVQEGAAGPWQEVLPEDIQLHEGDLLEVSFTVRTEVEDGVPQITGGLTAEMGLVQWHE